MALVAYSDESDLSDDENSSNSDLLSNTGENIKFKFSAQLKLQEGLSIKNDHHLESELNKSATIELELVNKIHSPLNTSNESFNTEESFSNINDSDVVNDVPTVDTWAITKGLTKSVVDSNKFPVKHIKKKKKTKFILPSLSEFDSDDEEDRTCISLPTTKTGPSSSGTGLLSMLPGPKVARIHEPRVISRRLQKISNSVIPSKRAIPPISVIPPKRAILEDEDLDYPLNGDFFSLSQENIMTPVNVDSIEQLPLVLPRPSSQSTCNASSLNEQMPMPDSTPTQPQVQTSNSMDEEAIRRLTGRKTKDQLLNIIEIKADDALMSKEEWMIKSLAVEKPTHSFSNKKGGLPTHQQKRKHQITFLAHQAKERELELKNNWAQNKMTKMQTQSKYGF